MRPVRKRTRATFELDRYEMVSAGGSYYLPRDSRLLLLDRVQFVQTPKGSIVFERTCNVFGESREASPLRQTPLDCVPERPYHEEATIRRWDDSPRPHEAFHATSMETEDTFSTILFRFLDGEKSISMG
jgi:hypothetical protein